MVENKLKKLEDVKTRPTDKPPSKKQAALLHQRYKWITPQIKTVKPRQEPKSPVQPLENKAGLRPSGEKSVKNSKGSVFYQENS